MIIEKLKEMSVEEQIRILNTPDLLKEILLNVNEDDFVHYLQYLDELDNSNFDDNVCVQIFNKAIEKFIDDEVFIKYLVFSGNFNDLLASYISKIDDKIITSIINSNSSGKNSLAIAYFIGDMSDEQIQRHSNEIKYFIEKMDSNNLVSPKSFSKNSDILLFYLDKHPEKIMDLNNDILSTLPRDFIKKCLETGKYDFSDLCLDIPDIITGDVEYLKLYLENSEGINSSLIERIINNLEPQLLDYDLYILALEKGYKYDSDSPDIIIKNPQFLKETIKNYGKNSICKSELDTLPSNIFTPDIFKLAFENGYIPDEKSPKYIYENFEYLKYFFGRDVFKYIRMVPKEQITSKVMDMYLENVYADFNSSNISKNPMSWLSDDIDKSADLAISLMKYGYFSYVFKNFDDSALESDKVKSYLREVFPNTFDSLKNVLFQIRDLQCSETLLNTNPLSLPLVRYIARESSKMNIEKLKDNEEYLKEYIKVSFGSKNYEGLSNLTDNVIPDNICKYMFDKNFWSDKYFFEHISNIPELVKSIFIHGYVFSSGAELDNRTIEIIKNDEEIIGIIYERKNFKELILFIGKGINFNKFMSEYQQQFLKIYSMISEDSLKNDYLNIINSRFENIDNNGLSLKSIFNSGNFDLLEVLEKLDFDVLKKDLSDANIQCMEIFEQLPSYLKHTYAQFITSRFSEIEKNGIMLSSIYSSRMFELVLNLQIFDNQIIKNDLSKEQLQILKMYSSISSSLHRKNLECYLIGHPELNNEGIKNVILIFDKIRKTNSLEIKKLENQIVIALLQVSDPMDKLNQMEDIFLKNNLPTIGKIYKVFEIMHPDFEGFSFNDSSIVSPILKKNDIYGRQTIAFADLIKSFIGSNNRNMNNYLNNLELGNNLFIEISEGRLNYEQLSGEQIEILQDYVSHLNTLYNNTKKGKIDDNKVLTGNIMEDIKILKRLFSVNGKVDYNLPDRIIKMYCHFAGIDTLEQAKQYVKRKVTEADTRGRKYARGKFTLEEGDFVRGIGDIKYLGNILQNGSNAREYLGSGADSDFTPLDTDLCVVLENDTIDKCIKNAGNDGYGPIYFVLKNRDNRFTITRRSPKEKNQDIDTKTDLIRLEAFYTGVIGNAHYGIRTGFASSEVDYIITNNNDDRIGLEIAMNGFYIPVVDRSGKLLFSPDDYYRLRNRMNGLSYYGMGEFVLDNSISNITNELEDIVKGINDNRNETHKKASLIDSCIKLGLSEMGLSLTHKVDLLPNSAVLFNTGSTGRYTNLPGDGDFDYMMQVDHDIYDDSSKMDELRGNIIKALGGDSSKVTIVGGDIREFKTEVIDEDGTKYPVEIDITFTHKTDKTEYASDVCVSDRLNNISDEHNRNLVKANIILAKKLLKGLGAYKPSRKDEKQGGMGGIGVENWILQNGGTLYRAAKTFVECADSCSDFYEFKSKYKLYNFGINHMADKKGFYPHDNYIENMNSTGYKKMKLGLKKYLELCAKNIQNPCEETIKYIISSGYDFSDIIDKVKYQNDSEIKNDTQTILRASIDNSIEISNINLGQSGYMYQYFDGDKTYLAKPGINKNDKRVRPARACVQECASILQNIISPKTCVPAKVYGSGSVKVSVQEKIDGAHSTTSEDIIENHTQELLGEYVCDYLLGNFDSDAQNFIVDKYGVLRGIDKEQSFKYLLAEDADKSLSLDFSYNPRGSRLSIYPSFLNYLKQNGLSEENISYLNSIIEKVQSISDDDYIKIFNSYAYAYDSNRSSEILSKILQRKKYFEANIQNFIQTLIFNCNSKASSR